MNIFDCFPSKWIKAADLVSREHEVVIDRVELEQIDDETTKPVVYFEGHRKGLLLNRTNASTIADLHSPETDEWEGQTITLYPAETEYRGSVVACVRVRTAAPQRPSRKAKAITRRKSAGRRTNGAEATF